MSSAAAWRTLERRFRDLQPGHDDGLRAEWSEPEGRSHLAYIGTDIHILSEPRMAPLSVRRRFKSAAARAAALMSLSTSEAPDAWLDYLRGDEQTHALSFPSSVFDAEGTQMSSHVRVVIARVCEVSADLCERLADEAFEQPEKATETSAVKRAGARKNKKGKTPGVTDALCHQRRALVEDFKKRRGWDRDELARYCGMSVATINAIIREDKQRFAADKREQLWKKLGVPVSKWYQQ